MNAFRDGRGSRLGLCLTLFAALASPLKAAFPEASSEVPPNQVGGDSGAGLGSGSAIIEQDVHAHLTSTLSKRGLPLGYDASAERFVAIGVGVVQAAPGSSNYHASRRAAWLNAVQQARMQFTQFVAAQVSSEVESLYEEPEAQSLIESQASGSSSGALQNVERLIHEEINSRGVDLATENGRAAAVLLTKQVMASSRIRSAVKVVAEAEVAGLQVLETFEATNPGRKTEIGIIAVQSRKTREMARAFLGGSVPRTGALKGSIDDWVASLPVEQLIYTQGVLMYSGGGGELWCVSFAQAAPRTSSQRSLIMAGNQARANAMQDLREFAGTRVVSSMSSASSESLEELSDMSEIYESESSYSEFIRSVGSALALPGVYQVRSWKAFHPLAPETPLVGSVSVWRADSADAALALRGALEENGGSWYGTGAIAANEEREPQEEAISAVSPGAWDGAERSNVTAGDGGMRETLEEAKKRALESGSALRAGRDPNPEIGAFVLSLVPLDGEPSQEQLVRMQAQAKQQLGEFFAAEVSSETVSRYSEGADGVDSFFSTMNKISVEKALRGVGMLDLTAGMGGMLYGVFVISEAESKVSDALSLSMRGGAPAEGESIEVMATGIAAMGRNGDLASARLAAVRAAQREAVEKVMGMTVVGFVQIKDMAAMRSGTFADTRGFIQKWEELSGGREGDFYKVRIAARVTSKKLYDSYTSHLASMGSPRFFVDTDDSGFRGPVVKYLLGLGLPMTEASQEASYLVRLKPVFEQVTHPLNGREGLRLTLGISLVDVATGDTYLALGSDGRASNFGLSNEINRNAVIRKAFDSMQGELHEEINAVIEDFARNGRLVRVAFWEHSKWLSGKEEQVRQAIAELPGVVRVERSIDGSGDALIFHVWYRGQQDFLESMVTEELSLRVSVPSGGFRAVDQGVQGITYVPLR